MTPETKVDAAGAGKIARGLQEAIDYAKGACEHDWTMWSVAHGFERGTLAHVRKCRSCGVRETKAYRS